MANHTARHALRRFRKKGARLPTVAPAMMPPLKKPTDWVWRETANAPAFASSANTAPATAPTTPPAIGRGFSGSRISSPGSRDDIYRLPLVHAATALSILAPVPANGTRLCPTERSDTPPPSATPFPTLTGAPAAVPTASAVPVCTRLSAACIAASPAVFSPMLSIIVMKCSRVRPASITEDLATAPMPMTVVASIAAIAVTCAVAAKHACALRLRCSTQEGSPLVGTVSFPAAVSSFVHAANPNGSLELAGSPPA
jgi:hypothetical protein